MRFRGKKVNSGASLIETTAALALVVAVTFFVTVQDTASMAQAQRDARHAAALLFLENEAAMDRMSLPPWATNLGVTPHLALYGDGSKVMVYSNVSLIGGVSSAVFGVGTNSISDYSSRFSNCIVRRSLVDRRQEGYDGVVFDTYLVEVDLPHSLILTNTNPAAGADGWSRETISRTVKRVFTGF